MCFSAEASFAVGSLLLPAGAYCGHSAIRKCPAYVPLALIPVVFGIQQICEGMVWVGLNRPDGELVQKASLLYLQIALLFWPFWIPFSVLFLQSSRKKGLIIGAIALLGAVGGLAISLPLVLNPDLVETRIVGHSLGYEFAQSPALELIPWPIWKALYLAVIVIPVLMSDSKEVVGVGVILILLAAVSHFLYAFAYLSVWCFFAAFLSSYLCWHFYRMAPATPGMQTAQYPEQAN